VASSLRAALSARSGQIGPGTGELGTARGELGAGRTRPLPSTPEAGGEEGGEGGTRAIAGGKAGREGTGAMAWQGGSLRWERSSGQRGVREATSSRPSATCLPARGPQSATT
jgi:hypothetical protein